MTWFILKLQTLLYFSASPWLLLGLRVQGCMQKITNTAKFNLKRNSLI